MIYLYQNYFILEEGLENTQQIEMTYTRDFTFDFKIGEGPIVTPLNLEDYNHISTLDEESDIITFLNSRSDP